MKPTKLKRRGRLRTFATELSDLIDGAHFSDIQLLERPFISEEDTGGYCAEIGTVGGTAVRLEIWLDRFTGERNDRLYAGFASRRRKPIDKLVSTAPPQWVPKRLIDMEEMTTRTHLRLRVKLPVDQYNKPLVEHHFEGNSFFGFYDPSDTTDADSASYFQTLASSFFFDVIRAHRDKTATAPLSSDVWILPDDYVGMDRYQVRVHALHERDPRAVKICKVRDNFTCQVCGLRFDHLYGQLGIDFAEAHHVKPLAGLRRNVRTSVKDLVTVCANCHRILHRMTGERGDVKKLKGIVKRHQRAL